MLQTTLTETQAMNVNSIAVPPSDILDGEIIERVKTGDIDAYGSIMRRYNQRIYRIARSTWALTGIDPLLLIETNPLHAQGFVFNSDVDMRL